MIGQLVATFAIAMAVCGDARADKLVDARAAIEAVRYDDAQPLLVDALQAGGNTPARVVEIYQLSASTAIVLGQEDVAEQYYRRWLALVPTASLPETVAPKLRAPFVAAQAYMGAHGRLTVTAQRHDGSTEVTITSDPLAMVTAIAVGFAPPKPVGADHVARIDTNFGDVVVLDEFGNHLVELATTEVTPDLAAAEQHWRMPVRPELPLYRRPLAWAVPALVLVATGVGFAIAASSADDTAANAVSFPSDHFYADYTRAIDRRDRDALIANVMFGVGGACALAAIIVVVTQPPRILLAPAPHGIVAAMRF